MTQLVARAYEYAIEEELQRTTRYLLTFKFEPFINSLI